MLDSLANDEDLAIQLDASGTGGVGDEELPEDRHHLSSGGPKAIRVHRHGTPAEHGEPLVGNDRGNRLLRLLGVGRIGRQERQPDGVRTDVGKVELDDFTQEAVGYLDQDARAVAAVGLGAGCPAVLHVAERAEPHHDDGSADLALQTGDERDTAGVVLESRVVKTLWRGKTRLNLVAHRFGSTESVYG